MLEALLGAYASPIVTASILCAVPSLVMLGMSFLAIGLQVPDMFTAALQHLAAGIVLSAVAVELVPKILEAPDDAGTTLGMTVGFFFGISLFLLILPALCGEPEEEEEEDGSTRYVSAVASGQARQTGGSMKRRPSLIASMKEPPPHYPWPLVFAVGTDALVDGLLIGISGAGGIGAGIIISAALTVEMGFLGLTFAASLKKQPAVKRTLTIVMPPLMLSFGGVLGGALGSALADNPPMYTGLMAFGVAALLFLVTEELLLEAHENVGGNDEHIWWVDGMFFFGFYCSFLLEKFTGE